MRLPVSMKLGKLNEVVRLNENEIGDKSQVYYQRNKDGKLLLRKAMARIIPPAVLDAPKQGFSAPDASWFKGESIEYVKRTLFGKQARQFEFLDRDTVQQLAGEHLAGKTNRRLLIWSLLSFELWCQTHLE
jgi:asparagine synthase (glutamine-hydrolysing)